MTTIGNENSRTRVLGSFELVPHVLSFTSRSALPMRLVCRGLERIANDFLEVNQRDVFTESSHRDSPLYNRIYNSFANFSIRLFPSPVQGVIAFQLSIPGSVRLLGIDCDDRILAPEEIARLDNRTQNIQDVCLVKMWSRLQPEILNNPPDLPAPEAPAEVIRTWMRANPTVLQTITELSLIVLELECIPAEIRLLTHLEELSLQRNHLTEVPPGVFSQMSRLQKLILDDNRISKLDPRVFEDLNQLKELRINDNQLEVLVPNQFHGLTELLSLTLTGNRLHTIHQGAFNALGLLSLLHLDHNAIRRLAPDTFNGLLQLNALKLAGNHIRVILPGAFNGLPELVILSLKNNSLKTLFPGAFDQLLNLWVLDLQNNQLAAFSSDVLSVFPANGSLRLWGNPRLLVSSGFSFPGDEHEDDVIPATTIQRDIHDFFHYPCQSMFSQLYQLAAGGASAEDLSDLFAELDDPLKSALLALVHGGPHRPETPDLEWEEDHVFDDMQVFHWALKKMVLETFEGLTDDQKNDVYGKIYTLAHDGNGAENINIAALQWGKDLARDNVLRLIDAMGPLLNR